MYNFLFICWGYCGVSEQGIVCNSLPELWRKSAEIFSFIIIGKGASLADSQVFCDVCENFVPCGNGIVKKGIL